MATIAAVHDLSGIGRCSLTAAISILSAMGHHCCPLPTAILSNQTGFETYSYLDLAGQLPSYLGHWNRLSFQPDAICTGFLGNAALPRLVADQMVSRHPGAFVLVDPVMADNGALYPCFDAGYVEQMRYLTANADIITPNVTELFLLADIPPDADWRPFSDGDFIRAVSRVSNGRLKQAVVTGCRDGRGAQNILIDLENQTVLRTAYTDSGVSYSGTGDVFASIVCGAVMHGVSIADAVRQAAEFVSAAVAACGEDADPRFGIPYEKFLGRLCEHANG